MVVAGAAGVVYACGGSRWWHVVVVEGERVVLVLLLGRAGIAYACGGGRWRGRRALQSWLVLLVSHMYVVVVEGEKVVLVAALTRVCCESAGLRVVVVL